MKHALQGSPNGRRPMPSSNGTNGHSPGPLPPSADGTAQGGKDSATGRFLPGNKYGQGNPHYRKLAANRTAFLEAVGPEQVKKLAAQLFARAMAGDVDAARLVLSYAVGRPQPAPDPDRADADEWGLVREWPLFSEVLGQVSKIAAGEAIAIFHRVQKLQEPVPFSLEEVKPEESRAL